MTQSLSCTLKKKTHEKGKVTGQVEMLTFCCCFFFVLSVNLFFLNCIPKISRDTFIWMKKKIYTYTNEYIIYFTVYLFICLVVFFLVRFFFLGEIEMLHKETLEIDADSYNLTFCTIYMKCHLFCLKWLTLIFFLKRCSNSLFL